jgi:hypothetical protein
MVSRRIGVKYQQASGHIGVSATSASVSRHQNVIASANKSFHIGALAASMKHNTAASRRGDISRRARARRMQRVSSKRLKSGVAGARAWLAARCWQAAAALHQLEEDRSRAAGGNSGVSSAALLANSVYANRVCDERRQQTSGGGGNGGWHNNRHGIW